MQAYIHQLSCTMFNRLTWVLLFVIVCQGLALLLLADYYNVAERFLLRLKQDRIPFVSPAYQQNRYYSLYESLFRSYSPAPGAIIIAGDSMASIPDWNLLVADESRPIYNFGIPGDTLAGLRNRFSTIIESEPEVVILWIGINDALSGISEAEFREELEQLGKASSGYAGELIVIGIAPVGGSVTDSDQVNRQIVTFNQLLASMASTADGQFLPFEDSNYSSASDVPDLTFDGVHLNEQVYARLAHRLGGLLKASDE